MIFGKRLSRFMIAAVGLICLGELGLRLFWTPPQASDEEEMTPYHSLYGWTMKPNGRNHHAARNKITTEIFNSQGFRGPDYFYPKKPNEFRILILGDSHAEGPAVEFDQLFSEKLKKHLNENSKRFYQVINVGIRGFGTDQELLFFQNEGKKYQPDITILLFALSDVWYNAQPNIEGRSKPLFDIQGGGVKLVRTPMQQQKLKVRPWRALKKNFRLFRFVYEKFKDSPLRLWLGRFKLPRLPDQFKPWSKSEDPELERAWQMTEALLKEMDRETRAAGGKFLVFYVPAAEGVYPESWRQTQKKYALFENQWSPVQDSVRLQEICLRNQISILNPIEAFQKKASALQRQGQTLYDLTDGHWTPEGHVFTQTLLLEHLKKNYAL